MDLLIGVIVSGLLIGTVYALMGIGYNIIYKASGVLNLAQMAFAPFAAFVAWSLSSQIGLPLWSSIALTLVICGCLGVLLERFPLRPMTGQSAIITLMVTLGIFVLFSGIITVIWTGVISVSYNELVGIKSMMIGNLALSTPLLISAIIAIIAMAAVMVFFRFTKVGLLMRAIADNETLGRTLGLFVTSAVRLSWVMSLLLGGLSGILLGMINSVNLNIIEVCTYGLVVSIFAGLESIAGCLLAGVILGIVTSITSAYLGLELWTIAPYIVMIIILLFRPYGLFGLKKIERV